MTKIPGQPARLGAILQAPCGPQTRINTGFPAGLHGLHRRLRSSLEKKKIGIGGKRKRRRKRRNPPQPCRPCNRAGNLYSMRVSGPHRPCMVGAEGAGAPRYPTAPEVWREGTESFIRSCCAVQDRAPRIPGCPQTGIADFNTVDVVGFPAVSTARLFHPEGT